MKINLKPYKNNLVLETSGDIVPRDIQILIAGLSKVKDQVEKVLLLDLNSSRIHNDAVNLLIDLQIEGCRHGFYVMIISQLPFGNAPSLDEGLALAKSKKRLDVEEHKVLERWIPQLKSELAQLKVRVQSFESQRISIEALRLKKRKVSFVVLEMAKQVEYLLSIHREPLKNDAILQPLKEIRNWVAMDLKKTGA